ncbi:MAG: RluA family pseudouridine synthase [Pseudomonadota bacterium]
MNDSLDSSDTIHHVTVVGDEGRLDRALARHLPDISRSQIKQWILEGHVQTAAGEAMRSPSVKVSAGQVFTVRAAAPAPVTITPTVMPLDIIATDEAIIVINKPPGLVVHPAPGHHDDTLVNGLLAAHELADGPDQIRPGIVHRLDKDTSGLLVVAKTRAAHHNLTRQFRERQAGRVYLALTSAPLRPKVGVIDAPIGRHRTRRLRMAVRPQGGRPARTLYKVIAEVGGYSALVCRLATGRTHQIRVHLAHQGHPLIGDRTYSSDGRFSRQALHALALSFDHPITGERCHYEGSLADDLARFLRSVGFDVPTLVACALRDAPSLAALAL